MIIITDSRNCSYYRPNLGSVNFGPSTKSSLPLLFYGPQAKNIFILKHSKESKTILWKVKFI